MKRTLMLLAAGFVALALSACAGAPINQTPAQMIAAGQAKIAEGCDIVQPTFDVLTPIAAQFSSDQQAAYTKLVNATKKVCAANAEINADSLDDLVKTAVPAVSAVIATSSMNESDKLKYGGLLVAFQVALSAAEVQFRNAAAVQVETVTGATSQ